AEHFKAFRFYVIEPNDSVAINSIIVSRDTIFDENRFSSVPRQSLSILKGTEDIGGSLVPEVVTNEVVCHTPKIGRQRNSNIGMRLQGTRDKSQKTTSKKTFNKMSHSI
ncbi:hypothetical protein Tco_0504263, partial [Tanacetum coccineum]